MENTLLKQAREIYPIGSLFLSSTGLLKTPIRVTGLKLSDNYKNVVVNTSGGVLFDGENKIWAEKLLQPL